MTLILLACAALIAIVALPDTPLGETLKHLLIEAPARQLSRLTPGRIITILGVMIAGVLVALVFETEGLTLFGLALPEGFAWAAMFDIATLLDLFAAVAMLAATARLGAVKDAVRSLWKRARDWAVRRIIPATPRPRPRRQRRIRRPASRPSSLDDGPAWAFA